MLSKIVLSQKTVSYNHIDKPYPHVHSWFLVFFLSGSSSSDKWDLNTHLMKIACNSDFLGCKKKFCPIILSIEKERLTFHFCWCGRIALSCSNSYYWYFIFKLKEREQIILSRVFSMHFFLLKTWRNRHHACLCTWLLRCWQYTSILRVFRRMLRVNILGWGKGEEYLGFS